jgi:hypothetical protein
MTSHLSLFEDNAGDVAKGFLQETSNLIHRRNEAISTEATLAEGLKIINAYLSGTLRVEK